MLEATRCLRSPFSAALVVPKMAKLSASVPPAVNTISSVFAPMSSATASLERASASWARRPRRWMLDGFPKSSRSNGNIASSTSGARGVVALWSKYTVASWSVLCNASNPMSFLA